MRKNKIGSVAIPAVAWGLAADAHLEAAQKLVALFDLDGVDSKSILATAVTKLAMWHIESASTYQRLAIAVKPGRPKSKPVNALMLLRPPPKKRGIGAPVKFGDGYDIKTFHLVEEHRELLAASNSTKPTIRSAVEALNATVADKFGKRRVSYNKSVRNHTLSSYQRGKRLVKANQKAK